MGNKPSNSAKKYETQKSLSKRASINAAGNSVDDLGTFLVELSKISSPQHH